MTDQASQPLPAEVQEFLNLWAAGFSQVLEQVGGNPSTAKTTPVLEEAGKDESKPEVTAGEQSAAPTVRTRFLAGGLIRGELAFTTADFQAVQLGQILMSEPLDPAMSFDEGHRDAYAELLRQVAGAVATSVKAKFGGPIDFTYAGVEPSSWTAGARAELSIVIQGGLEIDLNVELEGALVETIRKKSAPVARAAPAAAAEPAGLPVAALEDDGSIASVILDGHGSNLDLLLDVELDVSIRFGQREMLLRDVLDLRTGAVIELEREVDEPAELLVAGRVVAHGEVVVVDGSYGLRITEILSPLERIKSVAA
jgi:flagellar motor switch protein FliN